MLISNAYRAQQQTEVGVIARKYLLVEWDHLKTLLNHCLLRGHEAVLTKILSKGSLIKTHLECPEHQSTWTSQSSRNGIPEVNMALCAGILLSGLTWNSFERALSIIDVQMIGERSFYYTQEKYLFPAIYYVYKNRMNNIIEKLKTERLSFVGDGRYDLPGHSAKFGTYTIMNANSNEIIDFFIAHVSNAGG